MFPWWFCDFSAVGVGEILTDRSICYQKWWERVSAFALILVLFFMSVVTWLLERLLFLINLYLVQTILTLAYSFAWLMQIVWYDFWSCQPGRWCHQEFPCKTPLQFLLPETQTSWWVTLFSKTTSSTQTYGTVWTSKLTALCLGQILRETSTHRTRWHFLTTTPPVLGEKSRSPTSPWGLCFNWDSSRCCETRYIVLIK